MSKMIQIRNVPDAIHRKLKVRAAEQGLTMTDYILGELKRVVEQPTLQEISARAREIVREADLTKYPAVADIIHEERERRGEHLGNLFMAGRASEKRRPRSK